MVLIFSIPSSLHIAAITSPVNLVPWSDISFWGNPKTEKKLLYRTLGRGMGRVVIRHKGLDIPGEVVHYH